MHHLIWKAIPALLLFVIAIYQLNEHWGKTHFRHHHHDKHRKLEQLEQERKHQSASHFDPDSWNFDWTVDGNNRGLSESQCDAAFPDLYAEIDRAVANWKGRPITRESIELSDLNEGGVRVLLQDGQLRVLQTKGMFRNDFRARIVAVLSMLDEAVRLADEHDTPFPDTEFTIVVDDFATLPPDDTHTVWTFTRDMYDFHQYDLWLVPDFNFWSSSPSSPSYTDLQAAARSRDSRIADKIPQVVWRGVIWTAPMIRKALLSVTANQAWADVKNMRWREGKGKGKGKALSGWAQLLTLSPETPKNNILSPEQFCDYAFVCNTEGRSYSSRLTLMLNCDSVPVSHELRWATHFSHLLTPFENFVPVQRDFADLPAAIGHYLMNPPAAQEVADNARLTFRERYTTPAATACYWRRLVRSWAQVAFVDLPHQEARSVERDLEKLDNFSATPTPKSITFEDFLLRDQNIDYPSPADR